jgi:lycopene beta-cyclase
VSGGPPLVVVGAGMSGLSACVHLAAEPGLDLPVVLVDDDSRPVRQRRWAFWSDRPGLLDGTVTRSFDRVRVHAGGRSLVAGLGRYRYRVASGAALRSLVDTIVAQDPRFATVTARVDRITDDAGPGAVVHAGDRELAARWVLDSARGPEPRPAPDAYLTFHGWRVRTDAPVFDPDLPTLFDFRTSQRDGASFVYVLPDGPRDALVEHTTFASPHGAGRVDRGYRGRALESYLRTVLDAGRYEVLAREGGALPLSAYTVPRRRGAVLAIGIAGGLLKPSTGYAFGRVQRDSAAIARSLVRHGHPFDVAPPSGRHVFLDRVLLETITRDPPQLERAFAGLFGGGDAETVLRFLDERTTVGQEARLVGRMPVAPFLAAITRLRRGPAAGPGNAPRGA